MMHGISLLLSAVLAGGIPTHAHTPAVSPVVTIHAKDFAFTAPKTVKSGVNTFRLVNDGKELHHLSIIQLAKGKTIADFAAAMKKPGPPPTWTTNVGGPNPAVPGSSVEATLSLDAGTYVLICFIPTPGETAPHAMKGMMAELTVLPDKSGNAEPTADTNIHLTDYTFTLDKPLTAGHHEFKVTNDAAQTHEVVVVELAPGKTMTDLGNWVEKSLMKGPPPGKPIGGMSGLDKGHSGMFPLELKAGKYGMICFVPDAKDGKSHFVHGMTKEFTVAAH
ncbi:MAG: hypothetical protein ABI625_02490 [bacterium]